MIIKTNKANFEFIVDGVQALFFETDSDSVNKDIYDSVSEVCADIVERLTAAGYTVTEDKKKEIETLCNIHFSDRF